MGGDIHKYVIAGAGAMLILAAVSFTALQRAAGKGVTILSRNCVWLEDRGQFLAGVALSNQDPKYKLVDLQLQARFSPQEGSDWPSGAIRAKLERVSQYVKVLVGPEGEESAEVVFDFPLPGRFTCTVKGWVLGYEAFDEPPSPELIQMLQSARGG